MSTVRLYLPEIVLLLWAAVWAAGATSDAVVVVGLVATAAAVAVCCRELLHRYHEHHVRHRLP